MADSDGAVRRGSAAGEIQRRRILDAVVDVVCERGVAGASVGLVIARAKVSRHAFYERFDGLDECLVAILDGALERAAPLVVGAFDHLTPTHPWQEGLRAALAAMLDFFDEQPALARVCLLELGAATAVVREHRERILAAFAGMVVARIEREVSHPSPLAAEGTYASLVGIVGARLTGSERRPLVELLGPLMGMIVGPFMGEAEVVREIELGNELARELLARRASRAPQVGDGNVHVPDELLSARAHRARLCLLYVAEQNRLGFAPSNRQVGEGLGLTRRGQVSRLLGKLAGLGLIVKHSEGAGYPNAWSLTPEGERVARMLAEQ
jgi:AcrR family transcriptional regulator